jgi:hypothetical protein
MVRVVQRLAFPVRWQLRASASFVQIMARHPAVDSEIQKMSGKIMSRDREAA